MMEDKNISGSLPLWINLPNLKSLIIKSDQKATKKKFL
jgi:hypothetical protein